VIIVGRQQMEASRWWERWSGRNVPCDASATPGLIRSAIASVVINEERHGPRASLSGILAWASRRSQGAPATSESDAYRASLGVVQPASASGMESHAPEDPERDRLLMRRVLARDEDAFAALYDRYAAQVNGVAYSILRSPALAEDATHDVFLRLWQQPDAFDPARGTFAGWLLRVARNRAIDVLRRRREDAGDVTAWIADTAPGPEEEALDGMHRQEIRRALDELSPDHRQLLELAYFAGLSQTQISGRLGRPLGTVKSQIRAAMGRLADRLTASDEMITSDSYADRERRA
jgi:RNA polymerase sigma-70 factor, ECF subfamily